MDTPDRDAHAEDKEPAEKPAPESKRARRGGTPPQPVERAVTEPPERRG